MSFLRNLYFFQGQKYTSFGKNILLRQSTSFGHSSTGHPGFRPQRAKNTVQTTIAFADHQNIICMNYELQFVLLYPCSSHNTWACASRQIWNMTSYNKMLDHDNSWPQFLVVQFQRNLEPAAVPGTGPLHLLPPLPHLRLHFIILNNANRRYLILGQFI